MANLILFDIDYTLIDNNALEKSISTRISRELNISTIITNALFKKYSESLTSHLEYKPKELIAYIGDNLGSPESLIQSFFEEPEHYHNALFSEVKGLFENLKNKGFHLGIFSAGDKEYQRKKLELTGLIQFLTDSDIFIFDKKIDPGVVQTLPESLVVDDQQDSITMLTQNKLLEPIWINRIDSQVHPLARTINSLDVLSSM